MQRRAFHAFSRLVAALLLVWTFADLSKPSLCSSDEPNAIASQTATLIKAISHGRTPSIPTPATDDCFCCCSHIVGTGRVLLVAPVVMPAPVAPASIVALVSAPLVLPYHPPLV